MVIEICELGSIHWILSKCKDNHNQCYLKSRCFKVLKTVDFPPFQAKQFIKDKTYILKGHCLNGAPCGLN